jgi:hypothetical protein
MQVQIMMESTAAAFLRAWLGREPARCAYLKAELLFSGLALMLPLAMATVLVLHPTRAKSEAAALPLEVRVDNFTFWGQLMSRHENEAQVIVICLSRREYLSAFFGSHNN